MPDGAVKGLGEAQAAAKRGPPPVHLWNLPFCGDIDMRIAADGTWYYLGSPIGRAPLVKLFSSILRKDPDRYVMVTPVERVGIQVDDAPFLAVEMKREDGRIGFRTSVDDFAWVGPEIRCGSRLARRKGSSPRAGARRLVGAGQAGLVLRPRGAWRDGGFRRGETGSG